jgi:hypothetical protein
MHLGILISLARPHKAISSPSGDVVRLAHERGHSSPHRIREDFDLRCPGTSLTSLLLDPVSSTFDVHCIEQHRRTC